MKKLFKITLRNDYAFKRVFGVEENKDYSPWQTGTTGIASR